MAGLYTTLEADPVAVIPGVKTTVAQFTAPTNQKVEVYAFEFSFDGTASDAVPGDCTVELQDSSGTSVSSLALNKKNPHDAEAIQATAKVDFNGSSQPATLSNGVLKRSRVHPQGAWAWECPPGKPLVVNGGTRCGFTCNFAAAVNATVTADLGE